MMHQSTQSDINLFRRYDRRIETRNSLENRDLIVTRGKLRICASASDLSIYGSTVLFWTLATFSVSWSFYTVSRTPSTGDQPVARPLPAHRSAQTQNKCTQTSMPQVGFDPTIPVFERAKTDHALDRAATVIGSASDMCYKLQHQTK
jgi:hypothetical protein